MEKPEWLSEGAEALVEQCARGTPFYDVLIVGSGYGGSVAAARLAGAADESTGEPLKVCVLERGREHVPGTFPNSFSELPGEMRFSRFDEPGAKGASDGLFDLRIGKEVSVLVANGLGGGSLVNAGVAAIPEPDVFETGWPREIREAFADAEAMREAYRQASGKLGARLAQVGARGTYPEIAKHAAFVRFAGEARAERAAVTYDDETCRRCGDCATGCNVGAKTTLSHTYLGAARARGAKLYTGATVSHLERDGGAWTVHFSLTAQPRPLEARPLRALRAATVILAAGAFGSTEILLRSKQSGGLAFSPRLGERFSTNGDMISALYGGHEPVNAAARESQPLGERHVGPTITGIAVCGESRADRVVLEELAIPGALRKVFGEVITTAAMLAALARRDEEEHPAFSPHDPQAARAVAAPADAREPLAVDEQALERCQVFAAMGDDGAGGRLELVPGWQDLPEPARARDGAIRVDWPDAGQQPIYAKQDALLAGLAKGRGTYLRNPLWQPIPPDVSRFFSGAKPAGLLFSVHPLGGCPMGDDETRGVVDHLGRVFDPQKQADGKGVHEGLLVLDGSIVPVALGINPLLTITVLAERALELYCRGRWTRPTAPPQPLPEAPRIERPPPPAAVTGVRFSERAGGALRLAPGGPQVEARLDFDFDEVGEIAAFLEDPRHPMQGRGTLGLREAADQDFGPPCALSGDVQFLVRGASTSSGRIWPALWTYACTRLVADVRSWWRNGRKPLGAPDAAPAGDAARPSFAERVRRDGFWLALADRLLRPLLDRFSVGRGYVTLASRIGELRHVFYELRLDSALEGRGGRLPAGTRISGRKFFRYAAPQSLCHPFGGNPWRQLADLELTAHPPGGAPFRMGLLSVDVGHFFHGFDSRLSISRQRDLPSAWLDLAALGLFFARVLLKAHFWSFRLPDYAKYDPRRDAARLPGELPGLRMERYIVGYPPSDAERVVLPLTRYCEGGAPERGPVLLVHGLGASGNQFCSTRVRPNLAQHLAARGFDVWVAELRTSIALPYSAEQWTIDEVARKDLPRIVDLVLETTGARQLDVVAHCIGSAMFCTAVLDGRLQRADGESKIRSAALLQVGPLVTLSKGSRLRALAIAPLRRLLPARHLDFSVDDRAGWLESLVDRVLNTYPYPPEEARHHRPGLGGRNARHIANCNRWAAIDGRMISHRKVSARMLDGLGEVLGHASITTWEQTIQYALLERLTDWEGTNAYVTAGNIRRFFTFPVRFLHGAENDVFAPLTAWRSHELLRRVQGRDFPSEVVMLRGYSHLDPLIGEAADLEVFPYVSAFLKREHRWTPEPRPQTHFDLRRPLVGPVLGWLRRTRAGWRVRVWCRLDDRRSPVAYALVQVCANGERGRPQRVLPGESMGEDGTLQSLTTGPMDTVLCVDVDLGEAPPPRCEIIVRSVHPALEEEPEVAKAHRLAESAAGVPLSRSPLAAAGELLALTDAHPGKLSEIARVSAGSEEDKIGEAFVSVPRGSELTFFVGSCRYPGWLADRAMADAAFARLLAALREHEGRAAALFLVGDQIYADATAGVFDPKDRRERFYDAYQEAWSAPAARAVLSRVPTYMMMDDHESGNDWHPQDALGAEEAVMRAEGVRAYERYQWLHSPGNRARRRRREDGAPAYHYAFDLHGLPVFVCDTRSGRDARQRILDPGQQAELLEWLRAQPREAPKIVVSPSVVLPFLGVAASPACAARSDGWDGFRPSLRELFSMIARETDDVIFLCGDAHLSLSSEIWFERDGRRVGGTCYCIVASPMYAPYPFANTVPQDFVCDNARAPFELADGLRLRYKVIAQSLQAGDGFTAVTLARGGRPSVAVYGASPRRFVLEPGCAAGAQAQLCPAG